MSRDAIEVGVFAWRRVLRCGHAGALAALEAKKHLVWAGRRVEDT
jgi:hypothetical protein